MAGEREREPIIMHGINLVRLRERVRTYIDKHHYESALFWADKIASLSNGAVEDVYWYAQTLYLTHQYHRASHLIRSKNLDKTQLSCRFLAAKCHYECKEWQEALNILDVVENNTISQLASSNSFSVTRSVNELEKDQHTNELESSINLLRGKVYEAMDNRNLAMECFREALRQDVYCFEAFDFLVNHHMLSAQEEQELIDSLHFTTQCPKEEVEFLKYLYNSRLKKYDKPKDFHIPSPFSCLSGNLDLIVSLAERHYYNCDFRECFNITSRVLEKDPYNSLCLPLHIAVLVELKKSNALFYLAHKLVDMYPDKPVSWFAVGCYYLLIKKNDPTRRYLSKATTLDRLYGPAWLAFGHSFAEENEHDQAMAAYFTASQLMKGCHLPVLYIGLEYGLTNNPKLAERFFTQALSIAPEDPFVLHEMGVIAFTNQEWVQAEHHFKDALAKIQAFNKEVLVEKWEPLLNNLGHTCRKLKKYEEALEYHQQSLVLEPQNPSTYSAIGFVYALMGDNVKAVDYFHKALSIRRDDAFSTTMLGNVIEALMTELSPCKGEPDTVPAFPIATKIDISSSVTESRHESLSLEDASDVIKEVDMEGAD
ncbi:hypothetical protein ACJMK2_017774 [Sinanodonta woodiana]|uniref:Cell division cycle protein 16 homolog n=1 Tax=Sinanodonta woodiana TaxID=1069815 RepID=A0ABD3UEL3_SINWO